MNKKLIIDKEILATIDHPTLVKIVLKAAQKSQNFAAFLFVNYIEPVHGEAILAEQLKAYFEASFNQNLKGRSAEEQATNFMRICRKEMVNFGKICKKKDLEIELHLLILDLTFSNNNLSFSTYYQAFGKKVISILSKIITLLKKIHPDYRANFDTKINHYLSLIHNLPSKPIASFKLPLTV